MQIGGDKANIGDVEAHAAGRDLYHGIDPGDLLPMIADLLGNESQWRRADSAAREIRQQYLDRRLDRIVSALIVIGGVLIVQTLALFSVGVALISLLWPRLQAAVTALAR